MRLAELRFGGGSAIATEAGLAGAGDSGDDAGFLVHPPHEMVLHFDEEQVAGLVEAHFVGLEEQGGGGGSAIAGVAAFAGRAGDDGELFRLEVQPTDDMPLDLADVEGFVGPGDESVGVTNFAR